MDIAEIALGGGSIAVGILSCFFGARYFRPVLSLTGFIIGLFVGVSIVAANSGINPTTGIPPIGFGGIALGVVIGLVLALILYYLFDWGVIIAGAFLGMAVGFFIINLDFVNIAPNSTVAFIIIVVCAVIGAGLGYGIRRLIIVVGTAFNGAMLIVYGLTFFIPSINFVLRFRTPAQSTTTTLASGMILVIGLLGVFVQWNITGKRLRDR